MFRSIHPFDQKLIAEFPPHNGQAVDQKIILAARTFSVWRKESFQHRAQLMKKAAGLLRSKKDHYAKVISLEMGKVLSESVAEVEKCADGCDYFAENAERFLRDEIIQTDARKSLAAYQPLGPVLAIMPWNFPFWQVFRFA